MSEVEWTDTARDRLADIWVAATPEERIFFEVMILELELDLAKDPLAIGVARSDSIRVVVLPPPVFWFNVEPDRVRIFRVTRIGRG